MGVQLYSVPVVDVEEGIVCKSVRSRYMYMTSVITHSRCLSLDASELLVDFQGNHNLAGATSVQQTNS
jgi:hypothetical protein